MAANKVKSSKAGSVAKAAKPKAKSALSRTAAPAKKRVPAKKAVSSPVKAVKSPASAPEAVARKKVTAAKPSSKNPPAKVKSTAVKPSAKAKTEPAKAQAPVKSAKKAGGRSSTPAKGKPSAKVTAVAAPKAAKVNRPAPVKADASPAGGVHETASTISTGGQQATRSFSTIMQGHAAIAKGIEARKAAAKAKNLARFPRPATLRVKATRKLTPAQSKTYEQMLLRLRDELSRQIAYLRGASLTRSDEVNPEEDGSDAFERQLALKLASNEGDAIFEIDEALQRIKEGVYAICQDCGCIINSARLKALPFVRRCIECKRVAEKKRTVDDRRYF